MSYILLPTVFLIVLLIEFLLRIPPKSMIQARWDFFSLLFLGGVARPFQAFNLQKTLKCSRNHIEEKV
jgi:hypothetical protein